MGNEVTDLAHKRAEKCIENGLILAWKGEYDDALELFKTAAQSHLTAESLTYWGWMEYQLGNVEEAISLCHRALEIDPEFGNPYNDIGSYLVVMGKPDEAVPWFEKAINAKRYDARHYPHINLGRIYLKKDLPSSALAEFRKALVFAPGDASILDAIHSINQNLN